MIFWGKTHKGGAQCLPEAVFLRLLTGLCEMSSVVKHPLTELLHSQGGKALATWGTLSESSSYSEEQEQG